MNINTATSFPSSGIELDSEGRLAVLVLEQQRTREEGAQEDKSLARQRFKDASEQEVKAMHEKAAHVFAGALAQGSAALAGAGVQFADALDGVKNLRLEAAVAGTNAVAPVLGKVLGEQRVASDEAEAKHAAYLAEQARWALDDANQAIESAHSAMDKTVDWVSSVNAAQSSAETGIIAGLA